MSIFVLLLLGVVQGLCEFLPISSSGHLVLLSNLFGIQDSLFVSIILHLATLFAAVIVLRKEIFAIIRHPFSKESISLAIATICTCVIAIILMPFITSSFEGGFLPIAFLISAVLLFITPKFAKKIDKGEINYKRAMIIGLSQGFAIFPGLSRSGTTISAGILSGADREKSAKFSFLLSIPIIIASLLFEILKVCTGQAVISVNWLGLVIAFFAALIIGIVTIKFMLKLTQKLNFKYFAIYLLILSIISAIIIWF